MIDKNKEYKTRDGREVRIYATDAGGDFPVQGAAKNSDRWVACQWTNDGNFHFNDKKDSDEDLIEVKKTETIYIHVVKILGRRLNLFEVYQYSRVLTIEELIGRFKISAKKNKCEVVEVIEKTYEV